MIEAIDLTRDFGPNRAVDGISFSIEKGEILGFLGPNGAGKSTTMRMIMGYISPTRGSASIGGHDVVEEPVAARKKMGYLPENAPVYPDMTVFDYLDFCAGIRGFKGAEKTEKIRGAIEKCFLGQVIHQTISTLSKGFKQRVCFAQSILHDPEYLIMDEPTDGLDPNQKHEVRMMIREMSRKKAMIISTHILDEVEALCTRAIIISNGRIVADDTPENLKKMASNHGAVRILFDETADPGAALSCIKETPGVKWARQTGFKVGGIEIEARSDDPSAPIEEHITASLAANDQTPKSVVIQKGRLDDLFRELTT